MNKVYFWQGILGHAPDLHRYSETISKLLRGEYKAAGLDLKKIAGCRVYSARVNDTHRLLFTTIKVGNKSCLLLLEVVLNHDYQKSRFLNPPVLKKFLALMNEQLESYVIDESSFIESKDNIQIDNDNLSADFASMPAVHFNTCFLEYSDDQNEVVIAKLPAIISGPPGSGKTCLSLTLLEQAVLKQSQGFLPSSLPITYVTSNPGLKEKVKKEWDSLPISETVAPGLVRFLTYKELLLEREPGLASRTWVDASYFQQWLGDYVKQQMRNSMKVSVEFANNHKRLMEELRIFSGYKGDHKKYNPGKKQSSITDDGERKWFITMATTYLEHLSAKNLIQPGLYQPKSKPPSYAFVVTDESDDFSTMELTTMTESAVNRQIAFCIGSHQNLFDNRSRQPYLEQLLGVTAHKLTATYRCPLRIVSIANRIIDIKTNLTGGVSHKNEFTAIAETKEDGRRVGKARWLTSKSTEDIEVLKDSVNSTKFAIITDAQFKDEVSKLFPTLLIFTPEEIKGMEYHTILLYRILDKNKVFELASKFFLTNNFQPGGFIHCPKDFNGETEYNIYFNRLFVSATRAQDTLYIFQDNNDRKLKSLISLLKEVVPDEQQPSLTAAVENTRDDWAEEAKRQANMGNHEHAEKIAKKYGITVTPSIPPKDEESKQDTEKREPRVEEPTKIDAEEIPTATPEHKATTSKHKRKNKITANSEASKLEQSKSDYVSNLIKLGITEDRLINLLKHKHAISLLFDRINNESSLFETIIKKPTDLNNLVAVCRNDINLVPKISAEHLLVEVKSKKLIEILLEEKNKSGKLLLALFIKANTKLLNDPLLKDYSARFKSAFVLLKESQKTEAKPEQKINAKELAKAIYENQTLSTTQHFQEEKVQQATPTLPAFLVEFGELIKAGCKHSKLSTDKFKIQFKNQVKKLRHKLDDQTKFISSMQELAIFAISSKNLHAFEEIIHLLINQGKKDEKNYIDYSDKLRGGKTLMHFAAQDGEDDMVDVLLESNLSSLESLDNEGLRPDDSAYLAGHKDLGDYMDQHRRERNVPRHLQAIREMEQSISSSYPGFFHDSARKSTAIPVSLVEKDEKEEVRAGLLSTDSLESLSMLIQDSQTDDYDIISAKLENWQADESTLIDTLQHLAIVAVKAKKVNIAYALVEYLQSFGNARINFRDEVQNDKTLLHFAAENGDYKMFNMLKEAGAQTTLLDRSSLSPVQCAYQKGNKEMREYLRLMYGELEEIEWVEIISADCSTENELTSDKNHTVRAPGL